MAVPLSPPSTAAVIVMPSGRTHQSQDLQTWSCVQWLGPDLVRHVSDCAPLPMRPRHHGALWCACSGCHCWRRYSADCLTQGLSAPQSGP